MEESRNHASVIDERCRWGRGCKISSAVGVQLCFDVNSTDGTLPAGGQPLVHAALVEEVHAGQSPGGQRDRETRRAGGSMWNSSSTNTVMWLQRISENQQGVHFVHSGTRRQLLLGELTALKQICVIPKVPKLHFRLLKSCFRWESGTLTDLTSSASSSMDKQMVHFSSTSVSSSSPIFSSRGFLC